MDAYLDGLEAPREARRDVSAAVDRDQNYVPMPVEVALGRTGRGSGGDYRPAPGFPTMQHLDYLQKFSTVSLVLLAVVALTVFGVINPRRAMRAVATTAKRRAGVD